MRRVLADKKSWVVTPFRLGVTTEGLAHNKYRSRCFGRGACFRRVGGCDIHAAFDSPTGLIYPAWDTGRLAVRTNATVHQVLIDPNTGKAAGVAFLDTATRKSYEAKAKVVVLAASTLESTRILLLSKSRPFPNGLANSSGHLGRNLCEHVLGPRVHGIYKERVGAARSNDDSRPGGFYIPRFRNLDAATKAKDFIRGYGLEGSSGQEMFPEDALKLTGFGHAYKRKVRDHAGAFVYMYGLGEVLPRHESRVEIDPQVKDAFGIPVLRFAYRYGDNEKKMCADMVTSMQEAFHAAGFEITRVDRDPLTEGSSVHELGTARMGSDRKTSVLNEFQQAHDVKNLFVVDGAGFVSAACQNPTWTIMALCWRSCDYLAEELRRGNL
jgi:choline dehydrogenase-like flavoprotein